MDTPSTPVEPQNEETTVPPAMPVEPTEVVAPTEAPATEDAPAA